MSRVTQYVGDGAGGKHAPNCSAPMPQSLQECHPVCHGGQQLCALFQGGDEGIPNSRPALAGLHMPRGGAVVLNSLPAAPHPPPPAHRGAHVLAGDPGRALQGGLHVSSRAVSASLCCLNPSPVNKNTCSGDLYFIKDCCRPSLSLGPKVQVHLSLGGLEANPEYLLGCWTFSLQEKL